MALAKICLTRKLKFNDRWQIFAFLTYFEKLLRRSISFAQRNFDTNLKTILRQFNRQKLNPFEGFAHGENQLALGSTFN